MSFVDRQLIDADPDPTLHFDADLVPDRDRDPTLSFTHVRKSAFLYSQQCTFYGKSIVYLYF
jgi:hypothetical protein